MSTAYHLPTLLSEVGFAAEQAIDHARASEGSPAPFIGDAAWYATPAALAADLGYDGSDRSVIDALADAYDEVVAADWPVR